MLSVLVGGALVAGLGGFLWWIGASARDLYTDDWDDLDEK